LVFGTTGFRPPYALAEYQRIRDEHLAPMYEFNYGQAMLQAAPPEILALFKALRHDTVERNRFFGTLAGTVSIPEYFAPENVQRIVTGAAP
jgi:hypothetical protein